MIIKELGKFIIIDEIRQNATASELYFLSCLLGNEMLSISEDWKGRIYTSQFIYDVLLKKKPKVNSKCLRVLKADVALKFKSKGKVIWVRMFEQEDVKNSVMFHFDDSINTYLYMGAFNEISSCFRNEHFMSCVQKGIDYVYLDTTLSKSNPYICTEDTINEIKQISRIDPCSKLALIIPNFGYEKLLLELVQAFPQNVYPTKTQRYILNKLSYKEYLSSNHQTCRIIVFIPGIHTEQLETEIITIYITVGDAPTLDNEMGAYVRQWSPLPSLMDQLVLMERIRPNQIIPIEQNAFLENVDLPFNLMMFAKKKSTEEIEPADSTERDSIESRPDHYSDKSTEVICSDANTSPSVSLASTKLFLDESKRMKKEINKSSARDDEVLSDETIPSPKYTNLIKQRTRLITRKNSFVFTDSSEDDFECEKIKPSP